MEREELVCIENLGIWSDFWKNSNDAGHITTEDRGNCIK
jgi:hypothetical protein